MIHITAAPDRVRFSGHAGYDTAGRDIVCAAVSALYYTLAANLSDRPGFTCRQDADGAELRCPGAAEAIRFVTRGLRAIADAYPDYVRVEEEGGNHENKFTAFRR